jgi:hypothetical protein
VAKKRPILRGAKGDDGLHRTFELADAGVLLRHEARRTFAERKATMKCRAAHGVCLLQNPFAERRATMVGPSNRPRRVIGLTAEAGGRSSRPNHALDGRGRGVHSPRSLKGLHPAQRTGRGRSAMADPTSRNRQGVSLPRDLPGIPPAPRATGAVPPRRHRVLAPGPRGCGG